MVRTSRNAVLLVGLLVAAAAGGCLGNKEETATALEVVATSATAPALPQVTAITTDWSTDQFHYRIRFADGANLSLINVEIVDLTTDIRQTIAGPSLVSEADGTRRAASNVPLVDDHRYAVRVQAGSELVHERLFMAADDPDTLAPDYAGQANYSFAFQESNGALGEKMEEDFAGFLLRNVSADVKRETIGGAGSITSDDGDFRMTLSNLQLGGEAVNDEPTRVWMVSRGGSWVMTGPDATGSGSLQDFRSELQTIESKADAEGTVRTCEKWLRSFRFEGTLYHPDYTVHVDSAVKLWEWSDREDGTPVWEKEESFVRMTDVQTNQVVHEGPETYDGKPRDANDDDLGLSAAGLGEDLLFEGFLPVPPLPGDTVAASGSDGIRVKYHVHEGTPLTIGGQTFETLRVEGSATAGASGTETILVAHGGPHAGLVLKQERTFDRGLEHYWERLQLTRLG